LAFAVTPILIPAFTFTHVSVSFVQAGQQVVHQHQVLLVQGTQFCANLQSPRDHLTSHCGHGAPVFVTCPVFPSHSFL